MRSRLIFIVLIIPALLLCAPAEPPGARTDEKARADESQLPPDQDRIFRKTIQSVAMGRAMPYVVKLPRAQPFKNKRYPIVYLLHGWQGDENQMLKVNNGLATKHSLIIVQPTMEGEGGWFDSPLDARRQYMRMLLDEIIPEVENTFPVLRDRRSRAITGFSMGGQGALRAAIRRPDLFSVVGATSGIMDLTRHRGKYGMREMLGEPQAAEALYRKISVLHGKARLVPAIQSKMDFRIFLECPVGDLAAPDNAALAERFREIGVRFESDLTHAGRHSREYYATRIDAHLAWIRRQFAELSRVPAAALRLPALARVK